MLASYSQCCWCRFIQWTSCLLNFQFQRNNIIGLLLDLKVDLPVPKTTDHITIALGSHPREAGIYNITLWHILRAVWLSCKVVNEISVYRCHWAVPASLFSFTLSTNFCSFTGEHSIENHITCSRLNKILKLNKLRWWFNIMSIFQQATIIIYCSTIC